MDSSSSRQSVALRHAREGVLPWELEPAERLEVVRDKLKVLTSWGNNSPGFQPYGVRAGDWKIKYPRRINRKTKVLELAGLERVRVPIRGTTRRTARSTNLLVTLGGLFLKEVQYNLANTDMEPPSIEVATCSLTEVANLLVDEWAFKHSCGAINGAIEKRIKTLKRDLANAEELRGAMAQTFLPPTL